MEMDFIPLKRSTFHHWSFCLTYYSSSLIFDSSQSKLLSLVDPFSVLDMAHGILRILEDRDLLA